MSIQQLLQRISRKRNREIESKVHEIPLTGYEPSSFQSGCLDLLSDQELEELNGLLPWKCFTVDQSGRRFGRPAGGKKRSMPQQIPDYRTAQLDAEFSLKDKHVLEIGCFEGVHTTGLAMLAAQVTAIDSRVQNVVKTMVRTGFNGYPVTVLKCNVEDSRDCLRLPPVDIVHHIGVLYHLKDPVSHLLALGRLAKIGLMLDTHIALPSEVSHSYQAAGRDVRYKHYREHGYWQPFAGMYDHAKWLTLDTIRSLLTEAGLGRIRVVEERAERNGPRALLFAVRA